MTFADLVYYVGYVSLYLILIVASVLFFVVLFGAIYYLFSDKSAAQDRQVEFDKRACRAKMTIKD